MRSIKKLHKAEYSPIADVITYRAIPTRSISYLDPVLFLNHHGPQVYPEHNDGLPFGPHPHRGMETVTFILEGDISHKDSSGHESVITAGGVQWMTAGSGLIHAEVSSDEFMEQGGPLEILQLWVNLPARSKMSQPFYKGLQREDIPFLLLDDDRVKVDLVAGNWGTEEGAFQSDINIQLNTITFKAGAKLNIPVEEANNLFFYVIKGSLTVNGELVPALTLAEFNHGGEVLAISTEEESVLLFGQAKPLNEPMVAQGPFVMNTQEEIQTAYQDYREGKFGSWNH